MARGLESPRTAPRKALALVALVALVCGVAVAAQAQPRLEREPRLRKTVGVAPFRNYAVAPEDLFREDGDALPYDDVLQEAQKYLQERLARRSDVRLIGERDLRESITTRKNYREGILLAREWFNLGVDHYRALRLDRALENLDRAEALYLDIHQDLVEPFALAELELYRGLALGEKGAGDLAHVAYKRMFVFNPWKRFPKGYHAPATETALQGALVDFQLTVNRDMLFLTPERIDRFLREQGLDALFFAYLERRPEGGGLDLHVVVYESAPGRVAFRDSTPVTGDPEDLDALDRVLTRWLACADWEHQEQPRTPLDASLFVDVGVAYGIFLVQPLRELFHNVGFHAGVAWQLSQSFDLHVAVAVKTTFPDPNEDLLRSSTSVRGLIGAGFTFRSRRLRLYIHPGVDIVYLGDIAWTTNANCKFFAPLPPGERLDCPTGEVDTQGSGYLFGLALATGLNVFLTNDLYLDIRVDASAYFLPFDPTDDLNFPMNFALGVGYAF